MHRKLNNIYLAALSPSFNSVVRIYRYLLQPQILGSSVQHTYTIASQNTTN